MKNNDFDSVYLKQCSLESSTPCTTIRTMARSKFLEIDARKLHHCDWNALLNTLSVNRDMEKISIRNHRTIDTFHQIPPDHVGRRCPKKSSLAIDDPVTIRRLVKSISSHFCVNKSLTSLSLEGLLLNKGHLTCLLKSLKSSQLKLKLLSFAYCNVGDEGSKIILEGLDESVSVLDLSGCSLTLESVLLLVAIIKSHAVRRHDEAWKHTLRYQLPNFDRMNCLRRLTINDNPGIGDEGVRAMADALENDVWVKAVDLQRCGVTLEGAKVLLNVLRMNTSLFIVDLRENDFKDEIIMEGIYEQLRINCGNGQSSFFWMDVTRQSQPSLALGIKARVDNKVKSVGRVEELKEKLCEVELKLKKSCLEKKQLYEQMCSMLEENKRLKKELSRRQLLVNDEFLSYIDGTFKQFNAFFAAINGDDHESKSIVDAYMERLNRSECNGNCETDKFYTPREDFGDSEKSYSNDFIED